MKLFFLRHMSCKPPKEVPATEAAAGRQDLRLVVRVKLIYQTAEFFDTPDALFVSVKCPDIAHDCQRFSNLIPEDLTGNHGQIAVVGVVGDIVRRLEHFKLHGDILTPSAAPAESQKGARRKLSPPQARWAGHF